MNKLRSTISGFIRTVITPVLCVFVFNVYAETNSILQDYINLDDGAYSYQTISSIDLPGATAYIVHMTSQQWRNTDEVDRNVWEHAVTIVVPDNILSDTSILLIDSGSNDSDFLAPDSTLLELLGSFALTTGTIASAIGQVPNQPLTFLDEPDTSRVEDDLVAYSWDTAMGSNDMTWAAYLPMTKSAVKAMDTVENVAEELNLAIQPSEFVVFGFSKRGAISWLTAAIDDRVSAISPGVFDTLKFAPSTENQRATYGSFPAPLQDYDNRNVFNRYRIREGKQLINVIDPYLYRKNISIPKYIINVSGDQFYPPDSSLFYIDDLSGETLLRYVPNTDHGGANGGFENAIFGLLAWYQRIVSETVRPTVQWEFTNNNTLKVSTAGTVVTALLWSASNPNARDFRLETLGANWESQPVTIDTNGQLEIQLPEPAAGWSGHFVEITFQGVAGIDEKYSTPIFILPDTRSFKLVQAILEPKPKKVWIKILNDIVNGNIENPELEKAFPIRAIQDISIHNINDALALLNNTNMNSAIQAQQQCMVTRLNIKDGQLDWYSRPESFKARFLWKLWNIADFSYAIGLFPVTRYLCQFLNQA